MPIPSSLEASFVLVNDGRQDTTSPPVAPEKVAEVDAKDRSPTLLFVRSRCSWSTFQLSHPSNNPSYIPGLYPHTHTIGRVTEIEKTRSTFHRRLRSRLQLARSEPIGVFEEVGYTSVSIGLLEAHYHSILFKSSRQ